MHRLTAEREEDYLTCPTCERIFTKCEKFRGFTVADEDSIDEESMDAPESASEPGRSQSKRRKLGHGQNTSQGSKGRDMLGFEPSVKDSTWVRKSDGAGFPLVPSAKTAALKSTLLHGFKKAPDDKVCFSRGSIPPYCLNILICLDSSSLLGSLALLTFLIIWRFNLTETRSLSISNSAFLLPSSAVCAKRKAGDSYISLAIRLLTIEPRSSKSSEITPMRRFSLPVSGAVGWVSTSLGLIVALLWTYG